MQKKLIPILLLAVLICFAAGCVSEEIAEKGDTVAVYYTLSLDDGTVEESNVGKTPFTFTIGSGQTISGFDAAVTGMKVGTTNTVRLSPAEAYGEITDDMMHEMSLAEISAGIGKKPEVGDVFPVTATNNGNTYRMYAKIMEINEPSGKVTVAIMPSRLTGEYLTFEITLDAIIR